AYRTYAITWTPTAIVWWLDGNSNGSADITINSTEEFHKTFFGLLNVAIGGAWPGNPDGTTVLPKTMNVDWVRYSKAGSGGATPTATAGATATATATPASGSNLALNKPATASANPQYPPSQ